MFVAESSPPPTAMNLGEPWLEHDERYRRSAEFLQVLRKIWTEDDVDFRGDFYRIHDFTLKPKPLNTPERPNPELFQGGNSAAARVNAGRYSDWYFSNGKDYDGVTEQLVDVRRVARENDREVKFGLNGFIIARDTEAEAKDTLREIIAKANRPAVEGFKNAVQQAGASTSSKDGMWISSYRSYRGLVAIARRANRQDWAGRSSAVGGAGSENISMYSTNAIVVLNANGRSANRNRLVNARATLYGMSIESEDDIPELVGGAQNHA